MFGNTLYSSLQKAKNGISNSNFFTKLGGWVDGTKVTVKNRVPNANQGKLVD